MNCLSKSSPRCQSKRHIFVHVSYFILQRPLSVSGTHVFNSISSSDIVVTMHDSVLKMSCVKLMNEWPVSLSAALILREGMQPITFNVFEVVSDNTIICRCRLFAHALNLYFSSNLTTDALLVMTLDEYYSKKY